MHHACRILLILLLALAAPARAADVVFPPGSRIGLAPPAGLTTSRSFFGFEDVSSKVAVLLVALPAEAFEQIDKSISAEALKAQGVTLERREALDLPVGKAVLVIGRQEVEQFRLRKWILVAAAPDLTALVTVQVPDEAEASYPERALRDAFASLAVRSSVPVEEQLGLLPFKVDDLAGFRIAGVVPGRALMLTDSPPDAPAGVLSPHMVVAIAPGGPGHNTDRAAFARDALAGVQGLKELRVTSSEPLRMGGQTGHQIIAQGKANATGGDVTVVQWLRFGGGAFMQLVGVATAGDWPKAYMRFRQVRDGVDTR